MCEPFPLCLFKRLVDLFGDFTPSLLVHIKGYGLVANGVNSPKNLHKSLGKFTAGMALKLALVTGATSGIGEALCRLLASQKIDLIITGRDEQQLNALREELSHQVKVVAIQADLVENREPVIAAIRQHTPDLLINNAGIGLYGLIFRQPTETQMKVAHLNADALLELTLEGAKALRTKGEKGVILNVSSAASLLPFPYFSIYSATKAFVNQLSVSLDEELQEDGIRVLTACPGMVHTHFRQRAAGNQIPSQNNRSMTPEKAAEHIWWQINRGKQLYVFNWRYRLSIFFANYLIPRSLVVRILKRSIEKIQ